MAKILTGIQSSGRPHLGNLLGAILPAIRLSQQHEQALFFIADLHSLTTIKDADLRRQHVHAVAAAWVALGLDYEKHLLYRQSDIPEVAELTWYLSCFTPFPMLANAHSFKDKSDRLADVNAGLFVYPVLMAADILLYDAEVVPVGKDQLQHLEITRDIARSVNHQFQADVFVVPEPSISTEVMIIPGTDGQKMSKSYGNTIDVLLPEKELYKQVKTIVTDATTLEEPKDPEASTVYKLYKLLASAEQAEAMASSYRAGGYGHGHAKAALQQVMVEQFADARAKFAELMTRPADLEDILALGAKRAREQAAVTLDRVRGYMGMGPMAL